METGLWHENSPLGDISSLSLLCGKYTHPMERRKKKAMASAPRFPRYEVYKDSSIRALVTLTARSRPRPRGAVCSILDCRAGSHMASHGFGSPGQPQVK